MKVTEYWCVLEDKPAPRPAFLHLWKPRHSSQIVLLQWTVTANLILQLSLTDKRITYFTKTPHMLKDCRDPYLQLFYLKGQNRSGLHSFSHNFNTGNCDWTRSYSKRFYFSGQRFVSVKLSFSGFNGFHIWRCHFQRKLWSWMGEGYT